MGNFCPPGSGSGFRIRIRINWPDWIRIRSGYESGSGSATLVVVHMNWPCCRWRTWCSCWWTPASASRWRYSSSSTSARYLTVSSVLFSYFSTEAVLIRVSILLWGIELASKITTKLNMWKIIWIFRLLSSQIVRLSSCFFSIETANKNICIAIAIDWNIFNICVKIGKDQSWLTNPTIVRYRWWGRGGITQCFDSLKLVSPFRCIAFYCDAIERNSCVYYWVLFVCWSGARLPPDHGRAHPPGHIQEQQGAPEDQEEPQAEVLDWSLSGTAHSSFTNCPVPRCAFIFSFDYEVLIKQIG